MEKIYRIEADINLDNIRWNLLEMKRLAGDDNMLLAVVKADAYGHGAVCVSKAIYDIVDFYAVAFIEEGIELIRNGIDKPILILGHTDCCDFEEIISSGIRPAVYDVEDCRYLSDLAVSKGQKAKIHIKIDTGMGRIGFPCNEAGIEAVKEISNMEGVEIEGIFTHYAKADEYDKSAANKQYKDFTWFIDRLVSLGIDIPIRHISNSAAIMEMNNDGFNMVRAGIVSYGLYPSEEVDKSITALRPAMKLISRVIHVKDVAAGTGIGYGWTYIADKDMKLATISAGYADGYPRAQSNIGRVIINGCYAPIVGRVCMDQFMVDVTDVPDVKVRDKVILIGEEGDKRITVEEVAEPAASFNYELVCNVSRRVPRVYIRDGRPDTVVDYLK